MQYPYFWYSVWLLLITPIPAALTVIAVPSVHRSIAMIPFFIVIFTYGFNALSQIRIKNISVSYILIVLIALEFLLFSHNYFQHTNMLTGIHRNDGTKQLVEYVNKNKDKYQEIQITNEERWFALYYLYYNNNFDPKYTGKFSKHDFRIDKIGKLNLIDTPCVTRQILEDSFKKGLMTVSKDTLIIDKISCIEELEKDYTTEDLPYKKIDTIHRYDGSDAFYIYEPITDYDLSKIGL
jgi:hypothetical protein